MTAEPVTQRNILVVEDSSADYDLITQALTRSGLQFHAKRIESSHELAAELERAAPDMVLCDHGFAQWDSDAVLDQVRARVPRVPFIVVTGGVSEETRFRLLARGADDCVFKDRLSDLRVAVRMAEERQFRRAAERERDSLRAELAALRATGAAARRTLPICCDCKKIRDQRGEWSRLETYLRNHFAINFSHGLCPECGGKFLAEFK
jgi:CheY-like chemotaxis protein